MTKHILIITDNLPDQVNGVVTTYTNIQPYIIAKGYNISYLHPGHFKNIACPGYADIKLSIPFGIGKAIQSFNADYIHLATEGPLGLAARLYLSRNSIKYTSAYHTKFPEAIKAITGISKKITWPLIRWFHAKSSTILTTTASMVSSLQSHGFTRVVPWTRGVNRDIFKPISRTPSSKIMLLCVSRVSAEKGLEHFLKLNYPNSIKVMVGDGPKLEEYSKAYPSVHFVGVKRGSDLAQYYQAADVFVFPSCWDTFGLVMIESMACGTPVAAYPVQGPIDVIEQNITGYMDANLTNAISKCLELDREQVVKSSLVWSWEQAANIFLNSLVTK